MPCQQTSSYHHRGIRSIGAACNRSNRNRTICHMCLHIAHGNKDIFISITPTITIALTLSKLGSFLVLHFFLNNRVWLRLPGTLAYKAYQCFLCRLVHLYSLKAICKSCTECLTQVLHSHAI